MLFVSSIYQQYSQPRFSTSGIRALFNPTDRKSYKIMADFTNAIEKLNYNNYGPWSARIKFYLIGQDLWDIVNGSDTTPPREIRSTSTTSDTPTSTPTTLARPEVAAQRPTVDSDALKKWKVKAGKAMYALTVSVEDEFLQKIKDA